MPQNLPRSGDLSVGPFLCEISKIHEFGQEAVSLSLYIYEWNACKPNFQEIIITRRWLLKLESLDIQMNLFPTWDFNCVCTIHVRSIQLWIAWRCNHAIWWEESSTTSYETKMSMHDNILMNTNPESFSSNILYLNTLTIASINKAIRSDEALPIDRVIRFEEKAQCARCTPYHWRYGCTTKRSNRMRFIFVAYDILVNR